MKTYRQELVNRHIPTIGELDMSYIWNLPTKVLFGPGMVDNLANEKMPGRRRCW